MSKLKQLITQLSLILKNNLNAINIQSDNTTLSLIIIFLFFIFIKKNVSMLVLKMYIPQIIVCMKVLFEPCLYIKNIKSSY